MARLYVFRADFLASYLQDRPTLTVDDSLEVALFRQSYSFVDLPMGRHSFRMTARPTDSSIWNLQGSFEASSEGPHFLAIWTTDFSRTNAPDHTSFAKDVVEATAIGVVTAAISGGFAVLPLPRPESGYGRGASEARFELVPEDQALDTLRQCEFSPVTSVNSRGSVDGGGSSSANRKDVMQ